MSHRPLLRPFRSPSSALIPALIPALGALALTACSGGGGGSSGGGGPGLDQGSYTVDAFSYVDSHPPAFHPLGNEGLVTDPLDETAIFYGVGSNANGRILDDKLAGSGVLANTATLFAAGEVVLATAAGNVDMDMASELVVVTRLGTSHKVQILERNAGGTYVNAASFAIPAESQTAGIGLGDVDGDHRDEIVIVRGTVARVYDDGENGFAPLKALSLSVAANFGPGNVCLTDFDSDGRDEIAIVMPQGDWGAARIYDDAQTNYTLIAGPTILGKRARWLAGDLHGDGQEELVGVSCDTNFAGLTIRAFEYRWSPTTPHFMSVASYSDSADGLIELFGQPPNEEHWDVALLDTDGDGDDELITVLPTRLFNPFGGGSGPAGYEMKRVVRSGGGWTASTPTDLGNWALATTFPRLTVGDWNTDGAQDALLALSGTTTNLRRITWKPSLSITNLAALTGASSTPPILASGDFDADGTLLRRTGNDSYDVGDPIPLVLLTAAPTKAGIAQNYGATSTGYSVASSSSQSIGVTNTTTYSVTQELSTSLGSFFGVSASGTIESSFEKSSISKETTTYVQGFSGGYDQDVIVFQGTLYHSYGYRIEHSPNPELEGLEITFDVPVSSKTYKWTTDKYNSTFGAPFALGSNLLSHTIGDPTSYLTPAQATGLVQTYVGWKTPTATTVGATNNGSNSAAIELENESTTSTQRTITLSGEGSFSAGFSTTKISAGFGSSRMYEVSYSDTTTYEGVVGDIAPAAWNAMHYEFGMLVYHYGVLSNSSNEPLPSNQQPTNVRPMQVVTFWTDAFGAGL